jgi:hypothetical protein
MLFIEKLNIHLNLDRTEQYKLVENTSLHCDFVIDCYYRVAGEEKI